MGGQEMQESLTAHPSQSPADAVTWKRYRRLGSVNSMEFSNNSETMMTFLLESLTRF